MKKKKLRNAKWTLLFWKLKYCFYSLKYMLKICVISVKAVLIVVKLSKWQLNCLNSCLTIIQGCLGVKSTVKQSKQQFDNFHILSAPYKTINKRVSRLLNMIIHQKPSDLIIRFLTPRITSISVLDQTNGFVSGSRKDVIIYTFLYLTNCWRYMWPFICVLLET